MRERGKKHERGQSLVEFALSLPILILILSGLIDIGRVYFAYIYLEEAAAEGALFISLNPDCIDDITDPTECADPNNADWRANHSGSKQGIAQEVFLTLGASSGGGSPAIGDIVEVNATMDFTFITPGMSALMASINANGSNVLVLSVDATHLVITE